MQTLRIALAQIDTVVGDISANVRKIGEWIRSAEQRDADLICFPELAITGYPPEDLLLKHDFIRLNLKGLGELAQATRETAVLVGFVDRQDDIFNAAALLHDGRHLATYHKHYLPTYGVFEEDRYFSPGKEALVVRINGVRVGVSICEDLWYPSGPTRLEALHGNAEVLLNLSSSPYHMGKRHFKERMFSARATDNRVFIVYTNLVGGQDELVFDGQSLILDHQGEVLARGKAFEEDLVLMDIDVNPLMRARLTDPRRRKDKIFETDRSHLIRSVSIEGKRQRRNRTRIQPCVYQPPDPEEEVLGALQLGVRAYVEKNGFKEVVIGLSGGIDSSLTAAIAAGALGKGAVIGVSMPSMFTSKQSLEDARALANSLDIRLLEIPIRKIHKTYIDVLSEVFRGIDSDVTEENLQARIRGNLLMALSNKFGWLVLTTGNKSEIAVGYCTLYGDTAGGFAVLKDVPKTWVYRLARYMNHKAGRDIIPEAVIVRAPTAELREGQQDIDSLPPYETLDLILQAYVEEERVIQEIVEEGFAPDIVADVVRMVDRNEYKRRQSPPGIKITPRAFGKERRLPITHRYDPGGGLKL